jgi:hypothetical protein
MQDQCTTASFSCLLSKREHSPGADLPSLACTVPGSQAGWNCCMPQGPWLLRSPPEEELSQQCHQPLGGRECLAYVTPGSHRSKELFFYSL